MKGTIPSDSASQSDNRPLLIGACCVALGTLTPVAAYQLRLISKLPDPPFSVFDSERITMSKTAHPLGVPDALLGLASFGTTLALAILSKQNQKARRMLGVKLALDSAAAAFNAGRQVVEFRKLCSWCTATAISAGVMTYAGRASVRNVLDESLNAAKAVESNEVYDGVPRT